MKKINAIDLDKTLIPYDSFRKLIVAQVKGLKPEVCLITLFRVLRLTDRETFTKNLMKWFESHLEEEFYKEFSQELYQDMDQRVLRLVEDYSDSNTINVLISASPNLYVRHLIELLGWKGSGSFSDDNRQFYHLYGIKKADWLKKEFPSTAYDYHMAISDSDTDDALLNLFKNKIKWTSP